MKASLRTYQPGDEERITESLKAAFQWNRSLEHWKWKFARHPSAAPRIALGVEGHDVVSHFALLPFTYFYGGRRNIAAQAVDVFALKGSSRRNLFLSSERFSENLARESNYPFLLAFPNQNSLGALLKMDWIKLGCFQFFINRLDIQDELRRKIYSATLSKISNTIYRKWKLTFCNLRIQTLLARYPEQMEFVESNEPPSDFEVFWQRILAGQQICISKDLKYLKWRYQECPAKKFRFSILKANGATKALIVSADSEGSCEIAELWVENDSKNLGRLLIAFFEKAALEKPVKRISFAGMDDGFFKAILSHFSKRTGGTILLRNLSNEDYSRLRWTIVWGDSDELC